MRKRTKGSFDGNTRYKPITSSIEASTASEALIKALYLVVRKGNLVPVKGNNTFEVSPALITITDPMNCFPLVAYRNNNPFAAIVESFWVLAGRNDISGITPYLPRAIDFSDDGMCWRAGYGPRLRNYGDQEDQLKHLYTSLKRDQQTRQAVATILCPTLDHPASEWTKDYPCNNWIQFLAREGKLDCYVAVRSNDTIWGFSGVNLIEWAFLLSFMAYNLGLRVGKYAHFVGSLHVYERHWERSNKMIELYSNTNEYGIGVDSALKDRESVIPIDIPMTDIDEVLSCFFECEKHIRLGSIEGGLKNWENSGLGTRKVTQYLIAVALYWSWRQGSERTVLDLLNKMEKSQLKTACIHYLLRNSKGVLLSELEGSLDDFTVKRLSNLKLCSLSSSASRVEARNWR